MISKNFKQIFWGYLALIVLPLIWSPRLLGYEISLQFIGYIIILIGLEDLSIKNQYFKKAQKFMYGLIILSFFSISKIPNSLEIHEGLFPTPFILILGTIGFVIDLMFTYNLLMGTGELSYEFDLASIYEKANKYWGYYWKLIIGLFVMVMFAFIPVLFIVLTFTMGIVAIILQVNILRLFWDCSNIEKWDEGIE